MKLAQFRASFFFIFQVRKKTITAVAYGRVRETTRKNTTNVLDQPVRAYKTNNMVWEILPYSGNQSAQVSTHEFRWNKSTYEHIPTVHCEVSSNYYFAI